MNQPVPTSSVSRDGIQWMRLLFWVATALVVMAVSLLVLRESTRDLKLVVAMLAAAGLGLVILARPGFITYLLVISIPLTSGTGRGAFVPFFRLNEFILIGLAGAAAVIFLVRKKPFRFCWLDGLLLFYMLFRVALPVFVSLYRGENWGFLTVKVIFAPLQYYLVLRIVMECIEHKSQVLRAIFWMLLGSSVVGVVGVIQALQVPGINEFLATYCPPSDRNDFTFLASPRVTSLFAGDWNACGLYMAMNVIIGLATLHLFASRWHKGAILVIVFLDLITVFLTASLASTAALVMGLVMLFLLSKESRAYLRPLLYLLPVLIILLASVFWHIISNRIEQQFGFAATTLIPATWSIRLYFWREILWPHIAANWVWGLGTTRIGWTVFENYYVFLILTTGIFGLLGFVAFSIRLMQNLVARMGIPGWRGAMALVGIIFISQILLANIAGGYFEFSGVTESLWVVLGFLLAAEVRGNALEDDMSIEDSSA